MRGKRWVERGKNLLIALLTLSAAYLLTMTPLVQDSGVLDLLPPAAAPGSQPSAARVTAAVPARMAVTTASGRYGVQYDQERLDDLFSRLGPLLGEALASSGQEQSISEGKWREYLKGTGIYFDFSGYAPLSALGAWLRDGGECLLPGAARRLLLAADGQDRVLLCWQDEAGEGFYACSTGLSQRLHLTPAVEEFSGNGAFFAFEDGGMARVLKPYTLVTSGEQMGRRYAVENPLSAAGGVESLLKALSFNGQNHIAVIGGEAYLDGNERLEVGEGGMVTYRAVKGEKYPACTAWGTPGAEAEAIGAAWELAEAALGDACGDAQLYLLSAQIQANAYRICFGYRLNGAAVDLRDTGWAAEFWIKNGFVVKFTLHCRSYTASAEETLLLPIDRAAVMLPDLTGEKVELAVRYRDAGGAAVEPEWIFEE